jgi:acid stress chaperone HdeB
MPKKRSYLIFILLTSTILLSSASLAVADSINLKTLSCGNFMHTASQDADEAAFISIWLDGYLSGITGDTVVSESGFEIFITKLQQSCQRSPNANILDVARIIGIQ